MANISSLHESLLLVIISLLSFKDAIKTCILSKSWVHLWKKSPCVEFNEHFVEHFESSSSREVRRSVFLKFMTLWLDNHDEVVVKKFSLIFSYPENDREIIERCIVFVTQHGVKELKLNFSNPFWEQQVIPKRRAALFEFPAYAYEYNKSIESLTLFSCSFLENGLSNWEALKEVTFGWMEVTLEAITTLLSNCKMIESLVLKKCWNLSHFEIRGNEAFRLKRLVVDKCIFENATFKLNAPNLCFFKYIGAMCLSDVKNTLAIKEAHLDFYLNFDNAGIDMFLYDFVKDLYNVKILSVCTYLLQVIHMGEKIRMERDMNTRYLILKMMKTHDCEFRGVSFFLHSCPMLECLTLELGPDIIFQDEDQDDQATWMDSDEDQDYQAMWMYSDEDHDYQAMSMDSDHEDYYDNSNNNDNDDYRDLINTVDRIMGMKILCTYKCLETSLKLVEVKDFVGTENKLILLCYLIRCGKFLKRININVLKGELDGAKNVAFTVQ